MLFNLTKNLSYINYKFFQTSLHKHFHEEYSIGLIYDGQHTFSSEKKTYILPKGVMRVINPYEFHSTLNSTWSHINFNPTVKLINTIASDIFQDVIKEPIIFEPIIVDKKAINLLNRLYLSLKEDNENSLHVDSCVIDFFEYLIRYYSIKNSKKTKDITCSKKQIYTTLEYIKEHAHRQNIELHELANVANISKYHFLREFKKHIGITPHQYIQITRINSARKLLRNDASLSLTAFECGFTDQSHMIKVYKKYFGYTPSKLK